MALAATAPTQARVAWDGRHARPGRIVAAGRRLVVHALNGRRDEIAAYPAARGPRITYQVETDAGELTLVFDLRRRAWYVEATEDTGAAA